MAPGCFTELFFLDEATALAAGHRPCALCRREDYDRFTSRWRELHPGQAGAAAIDAQLHRERVAPGTRAQRRHPAPLDDLPDGAFILEADAPWLVLGDELLSWTTTDYDARRPRPAHQRVLVLTPPSLIEILRGGWEPVVPLLHRSAGPAADSR